jgi:hypothetical protein
VRQYWQAPPRKTQAHAARSTQQEGSKGSRLMRPAKQNTLVNGRWFILPCNKAQINATCIRFNAASKIAIAVVDLLNKIATAR